MFYVVVAVDHNRIPKVLYIGSKSGALAFLVEHSVCDKYNYIACSITQVVDVGGDVVFVTQFEWSV